MLAEVSSRVVAEWQAFYGLEPWGPQREDQRAGTIAATVFNVNRGKARALSAADFFPPNSETERKQGMAARLKATLAGRSRRRSSRG